MTIKATFEAHDPESTNVYQLMRGLHMVQIQPATAREFDVTFGRGEQSAHAEISRLSMLLDRLLDENWRDDVTLSPK